MLCVCVRFVSLTGKRWSLCSSQQEVVCSKVIFSREKMGTNAHFQQSCNLKTKRERGHGPSNSI